MIVVRIEYWPLGDQSKAQELERVFIVNEGTGNRRQNLGNYGVFIGPRQLIQRRRSRKKLFQGVKRIRDHRRDENVISLVAKAFDGLTQTHQYKDYLSTRSERP